MQVLRIGLVGAGGMGKVHIANYAHIDGCRIAALCDASPASAQTAAELGVPHYADLAEMLDREPLDVVDVCTPTFLHKTHVMTALAAGKNVICEKPLALHRADAAEMIAAAEKQGVQLFVGQVLQYTPETAVLRGLVGSGEYGRVLDASFLRLSARPRWIQGGWMFDRERSGHIPFDLHIHDLDLIVSLFGAPEKVSFTSCGRPGQNYKEHYRFLYDFPGLHIAAEAAWYNADFPFTATWRVYFENAVVENTGSGVFAYQFDHPRREFDTREAVIIPTGINVPPTGMFYRELSDFLAKIRAGGSGCARGDELLTVIGILENINRADR